MNSRYKIFFTVYFNYKIDHKKTVSKSFKSDFDLSSPIGKQKLTDNNIFKVWTEHALTSEIHNLNSPDNFEEKKVSNRRLITHRIINLNNLTEVF